MEKTLHQLELEYFIQQVLDDPDGEVPPELWELKRRILEASEEYLTGVIAPPPPASRPH